MLMILPERRSIIPGSTAFEQRKALASGREALGSLGNGKALTLTALWTIYGVGTLFVGLTRRLKPLDAWMRSSRS